MRCLRLFVGALLFGCVSMTPAQDNATQVNTAISTGSIHMDTSATNSKSAGANNSHGLNTEFLQYHIKRAMDEAIANGETPGGVVLVLRNGIAFLEAYGNRELEPDKEPATIDTIYDLASLTKPIATATSVMKLVERGKVRVTDPVHNYIPEWQNSEEEKAKKNLLDKLQNAIDRGKVSVSQDKWKGADEETQDLLSSAWKLGIASKNVVAESLNLLPRDREAITVRHLLVHTSGLPSFIRYYERFPEGRARKKILEDIAQLDLRGPVGGQFIYSDLGYIVLGDLVERVSGLSLDEFSRKEIFQPLGMTDTMFTPPDTLDNRIAPTEWVAATDSDSNDTTRTMLRGRVHDGNAYVQDGVSGHAGLFSTADDLAKFFHMMLHAGRGENAVQILSPATIEVMIQDHSRLGEIGPDRGLGWDLTSRYSSQKGDLFTTGYGHTGFTGTSVWVVPEEMLAVIILSNRVHPDGNGDVVDLRAKIANIVAGSITESYRKESLENP